MTLAEFIAQSKRAIWDDLVASREPQIGTFDASILKAARTKGRPQIGTAIYQPDRIVLEFIYSSDGGDTVILPVTIDPPERIVFMPVPKWVVETIWQGDIDGSYHFESHARELLAQFAEMVEAGANAPLFERPHPTRRE